MQKEFLGELSKAFPLKNTSEWFRSFPVCDTPLQFISLKKISRHLLELFILFLHKHHDGFTMCCHPKLQPPNLFFGELSSKKSQFPDFLEGKRYFLVSCLYSRLRNAKVFALIEGTLSNWPLSSIDFYQKFLLGKFLMEKSWIFWVFSKRNRHSSLPTAFLKFDAQFLRTHLQDPFVYCLATLKTS